ncbi:MAG TPA: TOBE domain-containing protein [Pseudonocardiaceae bacterium]
MPQFRISEAAALLGVSDDTIRRLVEVGTLTATRDGAQRRVIDGVVLAEFSRQRTRAAPDPSAAFSSGRNRLVGLVTYVTADVVMAQVEIQCGPHRVVSLISSEAVRELGLKPGVLALAVIKSTNVVIETPHRPSGGR